MNQHETNVLNIDVIDVIRVDSRVGIGNTEDPVRVITEYYDMDGRLIARDDPSMEPQRSESGQEEGVPQ